MAKQLSVDFLGSLPLDPLLTRCCDEGRNFLTESPDSPTVLALQAIVQSKSCFSHFALFSRILRSARRLIFDYRNRGEVRGKERELESMGLEISAIGAF